MSKTDSSSHNIKDIKSYKKIQPVDDLIVYFVMLIFSISTGEVSPSDLVKTTGSTGKYGFYSAMMMIVYNLGIKWQYGLSKSCEIVASMSVKSSEFRNFLLRTSQVFQLGDDLKTFFKEELYSIMQSFSAAYERSMESMKLMLGMYSTLISTSAFLIAAVMILAMLSGDSQSHEFAVVSMISVVVGLAMFVIIMYRIFPTDPLMPTNKDKGQSGKEWNIDHLAKFRRWLYITLASSVVLGVSLASLGILPVELVITISGTPLFVPGYIAHKLDSRIQKLDSVYPSFVKHFGDIYATIGSLGQSLSAVLRSDLGELDAHVKAMHNRVINRVSMEDSFELLSQETGSRIISSGNTIISNAIAKGADMSTVGSVLADITSKFLEMRRKRKQSATAFQSTILILHVLTLAVFGLMNKLIEFFSLIFAQLQGDMSIILVQPIDPALIATLVPAMILVLAGVNAMSIKLSQGGLQQTVWLNVAILIVVGGVVVFGVDLFLSQMFDDLLKNEILQTVS